MDLLFWIILVASLVILIVLIVSLCTDDSEGIKICVVITAFITFLCIIGLGVNEPTAMDVYQDKTTLKYTVVNDVKTDSTVIWKKRCNN
jgi:hypothetical protein